MSWYLYKLGRWSFRRRWIVSLLWCALLVVSAVGASTLSGSTSDAFSMKGLESTKAIDLIKERMPQSAPDGASARIVFQAPEGGQLTAYADVVNADLAAIKGDQVTSIVSPFDANTVSADGRTGYAIVSYSAPLADITDATKSTLESIANDGKSDGLLVAVGGDITGEVEPGGGGELGGVVIAFIVLVFTLGTLLAAGMSLLTALVGVAIGALGVTTATGFVDIGSTTPLLAMMLGLAVGIDYALFIFSRYRHELSVGRSPEEAAGRAVGTAGTAVVFAGATVVIALAGLSIVKIRFLTEMGIAAACTVVIAVLVAITLLPAVFGFVRGRVARSKIKQLQRLSDADGGLQSLGGRWATFITRHRFVTFGVGLVVSAVLILPAFSIQLAVPDNATAPEDSQARVAYDLITENFGAGANGPLLVVVDTTAASDKAAAVNAVNAAVQSIKDDVVSVTPATATDQQLQSTNLATISIIPESGPSDVDTKDLVSTLRDALKPVAAQTNTSVYVSGQTAVGIDISRMLLNAFPKYLVVVVGLAFLLLVMVFRSILVPLKAVLGFLISIGISLGVVVAVAQWGWGGDLVGLDVAAPVMFLLPILLTGILFGLAMDYELFLVSRMREEYVHGKPAVAAIVAGFAHSARVVTAAAVIMISVFGSFALTPMQIVKTVGLGLAVGLLADAFLVRMTLVPTFMAILGDRMWWIPQWLDRLLPRLDLEGEQLNQRLTAADDQASVL